MRYIIILLGLFLSIHLQSQERVNERVYVHLDKDQYIAGEEILVKFYVTDRHFHPSALSKVGYIEICNTEKPQIQYKVKLENGKGAGKIAIPFNTPSGIYQLNAYTRYMRNEGEDIFFTRNIAIVNVTQSSEKDRVELVEPGKRPWDGQKEIPTIEVTPNKQTYSNREEVNLSMTRFPKDIASLTVSVVRNDSIYSASPTYKTNWARQVKEAKPLSTPQTWLPEYEGHIITGEIVSLSDNQRTIPAQLKTSIGFVGKDIRYTQGQKIPNQNLSYFYTGDIYGKQEVVTSVVSDDGTLYRMNIVSPFAEVLPESLPNLQLYPTDQRLMDWSIGVQLQHIMGLDSLNNQVPLSDYYYVKNHLSYDLNEYTRFNTMSETFIEFVRRVIVRRVEGKQRIKVLLEGENRFNIGNTLVLLDGIPIHDHEDIINYNPHNIRRINIYSGRYTFGGELFECMVSFITHRENLPAIQLSDESQLFVYDCPDVYEGFKFPDYSNAETKKSKRPDFRHTLYWNPFAESIVTSGETTSLSFYTSDLNGEYKVVIEGITNDGNIIYGESFLEVR